jgi:hypothetical protein
MQLLLPYLRIFAQKIYDYERRNHFSEKLMAGGLDAVDGLGRRGWGVSAAVWGAGVGDVLGWIFEEVGGGVREGVEIGLKRSGPGMAWEKTSGGLDNEITREWA